MCHLMNLIVIKEKSYAHDIQLWVKFFGRAEPLSANSDTYATVQCWDMSVLTNPVILEDYRMGNGLRNLKAGLFDQCHFLSKSAPHFLLLSNAYKTLAF